jgi:hypothetical protein
VKSAPRAARHNNGLVLAVRSPSLRSGQRTAAQAGPVVPKKSSKLPRAAPPERKDA